jgi:histidine 2-aminobutanoyltransferase
MGMKTAEDLQLALSWYHNKFSELACSYNGTTDNSSELEKTIDSYSAMITDRRNLEVWELFMARPTEEYSRLVSDIRRSSAQCVAIMEKYRAVKLLEGEADQTDYFKNIEACIEEEFGSFCLSSESKILLIGSGAFPMTPLYIAKRMGAAVIGIDIDQEAVELGRRVVALLGGGLNIRLENKLLEQLDELKDVTHIIFSSTVDVKYDLLEQLYALTNPRVIVAVRYGDGLKSLFNYPKQEVHPHSWQLVETVRRPGHVFDVALYQKTEIK